MSAPKCLACLFFVSIFAFAAAGVPPGPDPAAPATEGRVTAVTLYRGQALVTRTVDVDGPTGSQELVVGGLPEQIVGGSLYAEAGEALEIRAGRSHPRRWRGAAGRSPRPGREDGSPPTSCE